ncbi:hypothetical protein [Entomohabitans teleogrylli]|uniref:hypothetical protein n=1 Tax=Entomohabitans teleogrylli TaxID=1384589 RepID=UPI0012B69CE6|nr:hypothetical protein [Entomohabitans teleogrylli]
MNYQAVSGLRVAVLTGKWNLFWQTITQTIPGLNCAVFPFERQAADTVRLHASDNREVDDFANSHEAIGHTPVSRRHARRSVTNECKNNE